MTWDALGAVGGTQLVGARLALHWAAQVIAAAADRWLPRRDDDSHTAMTWDSARSMLVAEPAPSGLALALAPEAFELIALRAGQAAATFALAGHTLADALAWADHQHADAAGAAPRGVAVRDYDMPDHPVRTGARFEHDRAALAVLAGWFSAGSDLLATYGTIPLRVWPHHFDMGTIDYLDAPGEHARQIGLGLSPGDGSYAEPYFYVTPHPLRGGATFAPLAAGGIWRREGWTGAVLTASALCAGDAAGRRDRAAQFLASAHAGARAAIG